MPKYRVKSEVKYKGERHAEGETLDMTAKEAKQAVESGALEPLDQPKETKKPE